MLGKGTKQLEATQRNTVIKFLRNSKNNLNKIRNILISKYSVLKLQQRAGGSLQYVDVYFKEGNK